MGGGRDARGVKEAAVGGGRDAWGVKEAAVALSFGLKPKVDLDTEAPGSVMERTGSDIFTLGSVVLDLELSIEAISMSTL
jgi:hypothetical protein